MKNKKKATTPAEPEPKPSKGKKKSSSKQQQPPPPPPVRAPVNGSTTVVKQSDPVVTVKSTIPDEADFNLPPHTPSYVGISCAILGYGLYNRYNGSPGPSLQVSPQQIGGASQPSDEVDSTGPVTRLIAQFETLKKEQAAKAAAEYQALRSLEETAAEQGDFIPVLSPLRQTPVKKYPPVITETNRKSDEKIIQTPKQPDLHQPPSPHVLEEKKLVDESRVVKEIKVVKNEDIVKGEKEKPVVNERRQDEMFETRVAEPSKKREDLHVNEGVVVMTSESPKHFEQIAVVENIVSEEDQEDISLILSESKSEHSQLVLTSQSPAFDERSESDTGSVRIHDTPEPFESHQELLFDTHLQPQQSPSPLLQAQSPEQEIMKQEFLESAQIVGHSEEETVEDELSTRVQVSDSNEEALMREAPIGSTSSRKTSIESDAGSNEVLVRDGKWFLSQYELVCDEIRLKVTQAESDLETYSNQMNDDVEGRVRAGVGKANLLITSKLKQFHDLCIKNIESSMTDGFETKIEDLEGFWEMVSYQIEDAHHTFDEIESMRKNNWTVVTDAEIQRQEVPKAKPKSKKGFASAVTVEDEEAAAAKEEARKARLREAKRLQASKISAINDDVIIFAPSTDEAISSPSPRVSDPIVSVQTETQELIEIESSTLISDTSERLPQQESVPVDLLS